MFLSLYFYVLIFWHTHRWHSDTRNNTKYTLVNMLKIKVRAFIVLSFYLSRNTVWVYMFSYMYVYFLFSPRSTVRYHVQSWFMDFLLVAICMESYWSRWRSIRTCMVKSVNSLLARWWTITWHLNIYDCPKGLMRRM